MAPCCNNVILAGARKVHAKVVYDFLAIRHFPFSFLWLSLGGPAWVLAGKTVILRGATQNSHKSRLCFFTHQTFSIFIPLAVPWCPNLDPCCKSVILTGARKIRIKIVSVFLPIRHFPVSFLWLSLGVPTWILAAKV